MNLSGDYVSLRSGGVSFLAKPEDHGFVLEDWPALSECKNNKYLAIGAHKSARYVEGPRGPGTKNIGLIIDCIDYSLFLITNSSN